MQIEGQIVFTIVEQSAERVVAEMPVQPGILNPFGTVHAGAMIWFADVTATILILEGRAPSEGMQGFPLAITLNANLLGNQTGGPLRAIAAYVKRGRTVSVVRTGVYGAGERLLAEITTSHVPSKERPPTPVDG